MYKVKVEQINDDKTHTIIREPEYRTIDHAKRIADNINDLLLDKVTVNVINLDTNQIVYTPKSEANKNE